MDVLARFDIVSVCRMPGVRRLSAVLFVAPDLDVVLKPVENDEEKGLRMFSEEVMAGRVLLGGSRM